MQKYSVKIRIDSITLHHATWEDKILSSLEEAIAYYIKLHPKKTNRDLDWRVSRLEITGRCCNQKSKSIHTILKGKK